MKNIDIRDLWDKKNKDAKDLNDISSLIYGENYVPVGNNHIFANNSIYDKNGQEVASKISSVAPLFITGTQNPVGYALLTDIDINKLNYSRRDMIDIDIDLYELSGIVYKIKHRVKILLPDSNIVYGWLTSNCKELTYQNRVYIPVRDYNGILNNFTCTKQG